jgi:hypothetical protein
VLNERRKPGRQAFIETGDGVGGKVFKFPNIDNGFKYGTDTPDIGSVEVAYFNEFDIPIYRYVVRFDICVSQHKVRFSQEIS